MNIKTIILGLLSYFLILLGCNANPNIFLANNKSDRELSNLRDLTAPLIVYSTLNGTITGNINTPVDAFQWLILPSRQTSAIKLIFNTLNIQQAELRIYESEDAGLGVYIWTCVSCGSLIPPPFISSTGSISVSIQGVSGIGFQPSIFSVQYIAIPLKLSDFPPILGLNMNMGYASIEPITINNQLPANTVQIWNINQPQGTTITFYFSSFLLSNDCSDRLEIFDGTDSQSTLIFDGCAATNLPEYWLYATSGFSFIKFTIGNSDSNSIFELNYYVDTNFYNCGSFIQPDILTGATMILSDGTKSSELMRKSLTCSWIISASYGDSVSLIMNSVSLKFGSSVIVYDSYDKSGKVLWYGIGNTVVIPPIITSSTKNLYITYQSDSTNAVLYYGFQGEYMTNYKGSIGSGRGYSVLSMSSAIDIVPPGDGSEYSHGINYTWYITPKSLIGKIVFAFSSLNLLNSNDKIYLYDGSSTLTTSNLMRVFTGRDAPLEWFITTKSSATVVFVASKDSSGDSQTNAKGLFKLSYYGDGPNYHCGFTTNPATLNMPSWIVTDGSQSSEQAYPSQYCIWYISPNNATGIFIYFSRFNLQGGNIKLYIGSVSSGVLFTTIGSNSAIPAPIYLPSSHIGLSYSTPKDKNPGYGFSFTYFGTKDSYSTSGNSIIDLMSSTVISLKLCNLNDSFIRARTNLTWLISPKSSVGTIYFAFTSIKLKDSSSALEIYDGDLNSNQLIATMTGDGYPSPYKWIASTSNIASMRFQSGAAEAEGNFEVSYYSDGPNYHCGFIVNPGIFTAPSFVITDGSSSSDRMYGNQHCEWILKPNLLGVTNASSSSQSVESFIVLEFLQCDLQGGELFVYDGDSSSRSLLWSCINCKYIPRPIISSKSSLYINFTTASSGSLGHGFSAVYWTINDSDWREKTSEHLVLEIPERLSFTNDTSNTSIAFTLGVVSEPSHLSFAPSYLLGSSFDLDPEIVFDGRPATAQALQSLQSPKLICGSLVSNFSANYISDHQFSIYYKMTQHLDSYLSSDIVSKTIQNITAAAVHGVDSDSPLQTASICKYRLDSGSLQAISIAINLLDTPSLNGRLRIFGGIYGSDRLVYDSNKQQQRLSKVYAPCGKATILLEYTASNSSTGPIDYRMGISYNLVDQDSGAMCSAYIQSLLPPVKKEDPMIPVYIGVCAGVFLLFAGSLAYFFAKLQRQRGYVLYPDENNPQRARKYVRITPHHPKFSPQIDAFRNRLLPIGKCCVCDSTTSKVFQLPCKHSICMDDSRGYLTAALGDISMFPVKCPMHFAGCQGSLGANIAKRILTESQYIRFLEFSDRAVYGDGMRCIFCNNFVNFPPDMSRISRVECPYCIQKFCVRCKKPWHSVGKCPLDTLDASVESWKDASGAQKCPACHKLIEKDDPDTCNHMVHKITDSIPCVGERTDFCYLCGEEVAPDYPHEEVRRPGINHFPEGVFQHCRTVINREREEERERLKRMKRMKHFNTSNGMGTPQQSPSRHALVLPVDDYLWAQAYSDSPASPSAVPLIIDTRLGTARSMGSIATEMENFDHEWNQVIGSDRVTPQSSIILAPSSFPDINVSHGPRGAGGVTGSNSNGGSLLGYTNGNGNASAAFSSNRSLSGDNSSVTSNGSSSNLANHRLAGARAGTGNHRQNRAAQPNPTQQGGSGRNRSSRGGQAGQRRRDSLLNSNYQINTATNNSPQSMHRRTLANSSELHLPPRISNSPSRYL